MTDTHLDHTAPAWPAEPQTPSRIGRGRTSAGLALLIVAAAAALFWRWQQSASPAGVVERCAAAVEHRDWKTVYNLIAWPESGHADEGTFVTAAGIWGGVYHLQQFTVGAPKVDGDTATVPFTATVKVTELLTEGTRTGPGSLKCRLVNGEWKIEPPDLTSLSNGFLAPSGGGR